MNTFPLALSQKLEGECGKNGGAGGAEWLRILGCEVALLPRPRRTGLFLPGPGPREATSNHLK
jgi:hypothetical protein